MFYIFAATKKTIMKKILLNLSALLIAGTGFAQYGEVENGDFENWTTETLFESVDDWHTSDREYPGLGTVEKSTDAQHQSFSINMNTILVNTDTAFGYAIYGDIDNELGYPYSSPVDSLVFYAKYDMAGNDSLIAYVVQFVSGTQVPHLFKLGGTQNTWTRYAMNMTSPMQDSILIAFAGSDAFDYNGVPGSESWIDNIHFVHSSSTPAAIPNFSFEDWTPVTIEDPDTWESANFYAAALGEPANITKTTDVNGGMYAARLEVTETMDGDQIPGMLTNGSFGDFGPEGGVEYTAQPTTFSGYYKYTQVGMDQAFVSVTFWNGGGTIDQQGFAINTSSTAYTQFSIPVNVTAVPDSMRIVVFAGDSTGSVLYVDDLELSGGNVSTEDKNPFGRIKLYPNPATDYASLLIENNQAEMIRIRTLDGKLVDQYTGLNNRTDINVRELPAGLYLVEIVGRDRTETRQLVVK